MIELEAPRRFSVTSWPHRHCWLPDGSMDACLYCAAVRPRSRTRRWLAAAALVLGAVALVGMAWRLS